MINIDKPTKVPIELGSILKNVGKINKLNVNMNVANISRNLYNAQFNSLYYCLHGTLVRK